MSEKYFTVEQISKLLNIHPKTVQRYIREGKLRANKIGKGWRVTGHDLSVFTENEKISCKGEEQSPPPALKDRIRVSAVVDIDVRAMNEAICIINTLAAVLNSKPPEYGNSSMHTQHIPEENKVRITLWGGIGFMEIMMGSICAWTERAEE